MSAVRERQLVLRSKEGDREAFRELVKFHMRQVYDLAYGFVNDHDDAEDVAQEVFVKVFHSIRSFRQEAEFSTWLYRIVTNTSLDRLKQRKRKMKRQVSLGESESMELATNPGPIENLDYSVHIERALHELPTLQRAVVILRHIDGLPTRTVSEILKCSEGTVKTHLHRGLKKMRTLLQDLYEE
ncbi:MAG: sigma-70 family RNA polymerase sigma factor [Ignavibacteria bacterium]|nr:sigma-70 family RNA polymerase sigma factor [Ignavibacteria bacterium]